MNEEQMKAEFEAFLATQMPTFSPELLFERRKDGEYVSLVAHYSWKAWQAAIASQDKNMPSLEDCHYEYPVVDESEESDAGVWPVLVPDGFKIVPVTEAGKVLEMDWRPIDTAPKDNKRPLFIARFNDDGSLQSFDYDAIWKSESESWEMPEVYYYWASANGDVEEPTHWCFEPNGFSKLPAKAIEAMKEVDK